MVNKATDERVETHYLCVDVKSACKSRLHLVDIASTRKMERIGRHFPVFRRPMGERAENVSKYSKCKPQWAQHTHMSTEGML